MPSRRKLPPATRAVAVPYGRSNPGSWRPGWQGTGQQRTPQVPIGAFSHSITGVPLSGGQAETEVSGSGAATVSIGPQGLGTTWYPQQVTVSTSTGAADTATAAAYMGSVALSNLQGGQSYAGGGDVIPLGIAQMTPGDLLWVVWTGGNPGDTATINIIGTQDVLAY